MTASAVIDAIHGSYARGKKNGLINIRRLLEETCPDLSLPIVHVAGTNGKGSTCAMLESVLRHAGYRTGLYTSPFLQVYQERIRLNGESVADEVIEKYGPKLLEAADRLRAEEMEPTPFELGTALALMCFAGEQVDIAVVEVGMGGRLDPTNAVQPILCAITAIGLDHTQFLGDTLSAIAAEKAGIIKPGVPVVCYPADAETEAVFAHAAAEKHAPLVQLKKEMLLRCEGDAYGSTADYRLSNTWSGVSISLPGTHQALNVMTVLALVEALRKQGYVLPETCVREGIRGARWPARLEWFGNVLIDGAHNHQGVHALREFVEQYLPDRRRVLLTGALTEKLSPEMLRDMAFLAKEAFTVTPDNPRAMDTLTYANLLVKNGVSATPCVSIKEGLERAKAAAGEDGIIIAAGSLYFAGMLRSALGLTP